MKLKMRQKEISFYKISFLLLFAYSLYQVLCIPMLYSAYLNNELKYFYFPLLVITELLNFRSTICRRSKTTLT